MGVCSSSRIISDSDCDCGGASGGGGSVICWPSTWVTVIHVDGRLEEFQQPIRAGHVLDRSPGCFLSSSELMRIGDHVPHVPDHEELRLGDIYFLMPLSDSHAPLSLRRLCALAAKASTALPVAAPPSYVSKQKRRRFEMGPSVASGYGSGALSGRSIFKPKH